MPPKPIALPVVSHSRGGSGHGSKTKKGSPSISVRIRQLLEDVMDLSRRSVAYVALTEQGVTLVKANCYRDCSYEA